MEISLIYVRQKADESVIYTQSSSGPQRADNRTDAGQAESIPLMNSTMSTKGAGNPH